MGSYSELTKWIDMVAYQIQDARESDDPAKEDRMMILFSEIPGHLSWCWHIGLISNTVYQRADHYYHVISERIQRSE